MAVILIGGGARSGKSRFALEKARSLGEARTFLATAQALDEEMASRIKRHREERGDDFTTIEEPIELARAIREAASGVIVVDCLTLWLSNMMLGNKPLDVDAVIAASQAAEKTVIFVTNEVGSGIVPDNELAREFRDQAGNVNQRIAAIAHEVYLMVFGQPLRIK